MDFSTHNAERPQEHATLTIDQALQLAVDHQRSQRLLDAEQIYHAVLQVKPDHHIAHSNLGTICMALGRLDAAEAHFRQAVEIAPDYANAYYNLGILLQNNGNSGGAESNFREALKINPDFADANLNLGLVLLGHGLATESLFYFQRALSSSPTMLSAHEGVSKALRSIVPEWHIPMMNEEKRNAAYFSALKAVIRPDLEVFEIGTGSGLLSMMAAQLGAKKVTTCEAEALIAGVAKGIVADNGFADRITVIPKPSIELDVGRDLPGLADVLVSEIFSSELLGEHVLPSIEDAKRRLLKPGGRVIPATGSIVVALFGGDAIGKNLLVEDSCGFNLRRFNSIASKKRTISRNDLNIELLTDDLEAFRFDFEQDASFPGQTKSIRLPITKPGRCYGIVQWIRLGMAGDIVFENHPSTKSQVSNWQHCVYLFDEPLNVQPGQEAVIAASHNRVVPWFSLMEVAPTAQE